MAVDGNTARLKRSRDALVALCFCSALLAPLADQFARPAIERGPERYELRTAAALPTWPETAAGFAEYTRGLEVFYADTMGLRDVLLRWRNIMQWCWLGVATTETVDQASNGWAFYAGDSTREVYRGTLPAAETDMDRWVEILAHRRDECAAVGAKYLYVLCPSKEVIYPEFAPATWKPVGPSRFDQFAQRLAREPSIPFLDLRPAFMAAKAEDRPGDWLFNEYGTHWNGRGIYVAYRAILERLRVDFPELVTSAFTDLDRVSDSVNGDSFGRQLYIADRMRNNGYGLKTSTESYTQLAYLMEGPDLRVITSGAADRPRLVWFHDSFGPYLHHLLFPCFSYTSARSTLQFLARDLFQGNPDIVLETFVDRSLYVFPPAHAFDRTGLPTSRAQVDAAVEVWSLANPESPATAFGEAAIETSSAGLEVRMRGTRDGLLLPKQELAVGHMPILVITAVVPVNVSFLVFVRPVGASDFRRLDIGFGRVVPGDPTTTILLPSVGAQYETLIRWLGPEAVTFQQIVLRHASTE